MPERWNGTERRKNGQEDHDLLIEISNDLRHMVLWSKDHDILDTARFLEQNKEIGFLRKIAYGCVGVFIFVEFVSKFIK